MEEQEGRPRLFVIAGLVLLGFGVLWSVGGGRFLDRPETTLMMGMPFLIAGTVVTLIAVVFRNGL